ncbi:hypothetical protein SISNIDRAFT_468248 [Sistotremastrum niveocremeum HHB9708]|uniref:Uncharacterized protein n=1 Tax=Sistotremastrum niveocremeum HHB9708 TaxID=1314777 RepID=A0A164RNQ0_9AGAM|nr:hypothetical protein SISNIDRAFT_470532 [Sistotremastrum niveocremeum HHB9708]KZS90730.1 hypothetical protein SISNIDRAFT_468248 [Sistotremastrum niveocremeum HHB9708]
MRLGGVLYLYGYIRQPWHAWFLPKGPLYTQGAPFDPIYPALESPDQGLPELTPFTPFGGQVDPDPENCPKWTPPLKRGQKMVPGGPQGPNGKITPEADPVTVTAVTASKNGAWGLSGP